MQIDRPESVIVWKRAAKVQDLLRRLGDGTIPVSHEGLDAVPGKPTEHLRALLQHHGLLPQRDPYLSRFEQWIDAKLDGLPDEVRQPVQHFATWHHLRRVRAKAAAGASTRGPVHSAKQEITEPVKFLLWLHETYQRTAETCTQQDVDEWLATGPTTRTAIRTFFVVAKKARLNTAVIVQHRSAKTSPSLSQDQRLAWIHELLTGTSESLPYRVAGMLLLLYAQPLVKVVSLPTSVIDDSDTGMSIVLGRHPPNERTPCVVPLDSRDLGGRYRKSRASGRSDGRYASWVKSLPGEKTFAASPLAFDGLWIDYYLRRFTRYGILQGPYEDDRLFDGTGLCIRSYAAAVTGRPQWFGDVPHTHRAIDVIPYIHGL